MEQGIKQRIAIVGLGDIAQKAYLPVVASHPLIEPVLCTRNQERLNRLATQYRINETYTDLDELIQTKPAAAMVHSATESHYSIIKKLLTAKIPVFVDKPLSYTIAECDELLDLSLSNETLLYLGFNRRHAPFIQRLGAEGQPTQIMWQKNRVNLPGEPRVFVFDDFIHVVDSLLFLAKGPVHQFQVRCLKENHLLQALQVQWQQKDTFVQGSMNRISGATQELIDYYTAGHSWQINDFTSCVHFHQDKQEVVQAGSWESALRKKGFHAMIEDWLNALAEKEFNAERVESIRATHHFCERIVKKVEEE